MADDPLGLYEPPPLPVFGPVVTWNATKPVRAEFRTLHLDRGCPSLQRSNDETLRARDWLGAGHLADTISAGGPLDGGEQIRLCRHCAVQPLLAHCVADSRGQDPVAVVAATSAPRDDVSRRRPMKSNATAFAERAARRTTRIAQAAGLGTVEVNGRTLMFGSVARRVADLLGQVAWAHIGPDGQTNLSAIEAQAVYELLERTHDTGVDAEGVWTLVDA